MARFSVVKALVPICLLALQPVAAQNPYVTQLPQCAQKCFSAVVGDICNGNDNDWNCFCTSSNYNAGYNSVENDPACQSLATDCTTADLGNLNTDLTNACNQAIKNGAGTLSASPLLAGGLLVGSVALLV